jgi:hypothetical protein
VRLKMSHKRILSVSVAPSCRSGRTAAGQRLRRRLARQPPPVCPTSARLADDVEAEVDVAQEDPVAERIYAPHKRMGCSPAGPNDAKTPVGSSVGFGRYFPISLG